MRMRDQGGAILRQARRDFAAIGFDKETGLLLPEKPLLGSAKEPTTDEQLIDEGKYEVATLLTALLILFVQWTQLSTVRRERTYHCKSS